MPKPRVIDCSQVDVMPASLAPAAAAGIVGCVHKASDGAGDINERMPAWCRLAEQAGMMFGIYHVMRPGDRAEQFANFCGAARKVDGGNLLIAVRADDQRVSLNDVAWFLDRLVQVGDRWPVFYVDGGIGDQLGGDELGLAQHRLWIAEHGRPIVPAGWQSLWLWQYEISGTIDGIEAAVGLSAFQGDDDQLRREWSGIMRPAPGPAPEPATEDSEAAAEAITIVIKIAVDSPVPVNVVIEQI